MQTFTNYGCLILLCRSCMVEANEKRVLIRNQFLFLLLPMELAFPSFIIICIVYIYLYQHLLLLPLLFQIRILCCTCFNTCFLCFEILIKYQPSLTVLRLMCVSSQKNKRNNPSTESSTLKT